MNLFKYQDILTDHDLNWRKWWDFNEVAHKPKDISKLEAADHED